MDQNVFHKLQLEILNAIDLLLLTMTYGICWYAYYGDEISTPFYDLGNEIMVVLFAILYYFISHLYHGYRISISRIPDLVYSQTLAVFFADARKAGIRPDTFIQSWYQNNTFIFPSKKGYCSD